MGENSKIEWTTNTFNPWIGCSKVHTGCLYCYAESDMDFRRKRVKWGDHGTRSKTSADYWKQPLKWNREAQFAFEYWQHRIDADKPDYHRPRVFCASLADVFEDWQGPIVDHNGHKLYRSHETENPMICGTNTGRPPLTMNDLRADLFKLIDDTPNLDWMILTKRPENIRRMWRGALGESHSVLGKHRENVWLYYSASDQQTLEAGLPHLLECRDLSPVLGLSLEPLVGPIDFFYGPDDWGLITNINHIIVGGESGPKSRECREEWERVIIKQCQAAGVPAFRKQAGSNAWYRGVKIPYKHPKGGDPSEWPEDLRIRQMPEFKRI